MHLCEAVLAVLPSFHNPKFFLNIHTQELGASVQSMYLVAQITVELWYSDWSSGTGRTAAHVVRIWKDIEFRKGVDQLKEWRVDGKT